MGRSPDIQPGPLVEGPGHNRTSPRVRSVVARSPRNGVKINSTTRVKLTTTEAALRSAFFGKIRDA
jgi:hypothetical protein